MHNKKYCSRNKNHWLDKGYNEEDSIKMARSRMPGTIEYFHLFKGLEYDEAVLKSKEWYSKNKNTLYQFQQRHGDELGLIKFNEYRSKQAYSNSYAYKQQKYGWSEEQFTDFNKSRAITEQNLIKKYGELVGKEKFKSYCEKQKYAGCKIEYFIEKYGVELGLEKYTNLNVLKSRSLESYLIKFNGDFTKAFEKFNNSIAKFKAPISTIATELFDRLFVCLKDSFDRIYYCNNMQEWYIYDQTRKKVYFIDFFIKNNGKIIEFYGDYWHANPLLYSNDSIVNLPGKRKPLAEEIWNEDKLRLECIKKYPYITDIKVVWEHDYVNNKDKIFHECLQYLIGT